MIPKITELADEVRLTFHSLTQFARVASGGVVDPAGRAVLEYLCRERPSTVPDIARTRGVSRQHIQTVVNELRAQGLVQLRENPAHRRSSLIVPTDTGRATLAGAVARERDLLAPALDGLDAGQCDDARVVLADLRRRLDALVEEVKS